MNILKGFITIPELANNLAGQTAIFGELSQYSRTFSRSQQQYVDTGLHPSIELEAFTSITDTGAAYTPSVGVRAHVLAVAAWIYDQHLAASIPSNTNKATFINTLGTTFPTMTGISINAIVNGNPLSHRMPDYVDWTYDDGGVDVQIKIWFSDASFRTQYDDYEILVVPPVSTINDLNNPTATVALLLVLKTASVVIDEIAALAGTDPYTTLRTQTVTWNDPVVSGATLPTGWTLIIYGAAGNDADAIKNAIREYISTHSALPNWSTLYPTLYADNEFTIIPMWGDVAVAPTVLDPTLYASAVRVGKLITVAAAMIPGTYAQSVVISSYLNAQLYIASAFFRSLQFMVVGNPNNVGATYNFDMLYPDYMDVPTTSADFARMSNNTQLFVVKLNAALDAARTLTSISSIPVGFTRSIRNNRVFLSFDFGGFTYLVLAAVSYLE